MSKTITKNASKAKPVRQMSVKEKFAIMRQEMSSALIERDDEIDVVLTALICQEHPLLVGPPGTGKSLLLDTVVRWMGGDVNKFSILFNKFTTPEEVFGPISVQGLKEDVYRRITTNKLPEAHFGFGDEIFKASSAILNTLLRTLNERVYENGDGTFRQIPLQMFVAASNEWPGDQDGAKELGALFDRFLFRKTVKTVSKSGRGKLLWERDHNAQLSTSITSREIDEAHDAAMDLEFSDDAKAALEEILDALNAEGIFPGDRRQFKSIDAAKAYAYLCGADSVEREHLEILSHVLWDDPQEQPIKCAKIIAKIANPVGHRLVELLGQAHDVIDKCRPTEAVPKLQEIQKELVALPKDASNKQRIEAANEFLKNEIKRTYRQVIGER